MSGRARIVPHEVIDTSDGRFLVARLPSIEVWLERAVGTHGSRPRGVGVTVRVDPDRVRAIAARSIEEAITANQDAGGAYVASPNFPVYRLSWLRDGAFIADAMSRAGRIASAEAFFGWCSKVVLVDRGERIGSPRRPAGAGESIAARSSCTRGFTLDRPGVRGGVGPTSSSMATEPGCGRSMPIAAGTVELSRRSSTAPRYPLAYVAAFWDHPSYDWWEEHPYERHSSTLAALYAGLGPPASWGVAGGERERSPPAASTIRDTVRADARRLGHLPKWLGGDSVDGSLLAAGVPFGLVLAPDDPLMTATVEAVEAALVVDGGVYRYLEDTYYGGGQWLLLAAFLGWHQAAASAEPTTPGRSSTGSRSRRHAGWRPARTGARAGARSGRVDEWVSRWGPVATPCSGRTRCS